MCIDSLVYNRRERGPPKAKTGGRREDPTALKPQAESTSDISSSDIQSFTGTSLVQTSSIVDPLFLFMNTGLGGSDSQTDQFWYTILPAPTDK